MGGPSLVEFPREHLHDTTTLLRKLADAIDAGEHGAVGCVAVVVMGDTTEVFSFGPDSGPPSAACLLYAGFLRLVKKLEAHGR